MKKLIIIGAGGFGREVYQWAREDKYNQYDIIGFVDDNTEALKNLNYQVSVISTIADFESTDENVFFICALGNPSLKEKIVNLPNFKNRKFANIIHKSVIISNNATFGEGNIFCPNVVLSCDTIILNHNTFNVSTAIGHDVKVGSYNQLSSFCDLHGYVELKNKIFIGSKASIVSKVIVEDNARIGASSLVIKRVKENTSVFGVPAKKIEF